MVVLAFETYSSDSAGGSDGAGSLGGLAKGVSEHCDRLLCFLYTKKSQLLQQLRRGDCGGLRLVNRRTGGSCEVARESLRESPNQSLGVSLVTGSPGRFDLWQVRKLKESTKEGNNIE